MTLSIVGYHFLLYFRGLTLGIKFQGVKTGIKTSGGDNVYRWMAFFSNFWGLTLRNKFQGVKAGIKTSEGDTVYRSMLLFIEISRINTWNQISGGEIWHQHVRGWCQSLDVAFYRTFWDWHLKSNLRGWHLVSKRQKVKLSIVGCRFLSNLRELTIEIKSQGMKLCFKTSEGSNWH